ncbi:ankyrin repeat domain-containing protein [Variovorax sp. J22G73]|uniref:ankyrin repeat domain-containing protein n=1 Tax=unclassified Variovorax TaxID=663243 RepID=UPI000D5E195F|nr:MULTISPECIES: ankyrin repeat domain-containing protein [unclassified Variovorax]MDM0006616.1 ankyrin repeat domain-containing protein [Variovorax sp. J22R203]MDM0097360.1 ankyrin repeat domain-containing protein [Variovorax sp. J22G73]
MKRIPARPDIGHLKKQAKDLLALYRGNDPAAFARFRDALPAAAGKTDTTLAALGLRLHDAQSCVAREHGFASWADLQGFVVARRAQADDPARALLHWLRLVYAGDISGGNHRARPTVAARLLEDGPALPLPMPVLGQDPYLACAIGDEAALRRATAQDPGWLHRAGGPLNLPPLVAVTHSSLLRLPAFRERLRACASYLLAAGADANQSAGNRWPPASLAAPSDTERLSALYGAAGQNHDVELTELLLGAGADPNDGESLYHSLDQPACTRLLLQAGARVTGSNALYRELDLDDVATLRLLLAHGGDANEPARGAPTSDWGTPLLWALRRRRSPAHIEALLAAGADPAATTPDGTPTHLVALRFGLTEVARLLQAAGADSAPLPPDEAFVAACARADEAAARQVLSQHPGLIASLGDTRLKLLPELAAQGCTDAVKTMVSLGWPIEVRGGDIDGSALNQAVFRGDAALTRFLVEHGADWRTLHGYGDDARGSLAWASLNEPEPGGDWLGCAQALVAHGMPAARPDPQTPDAVLVGEKRYWFSDEVTDFLLGASAAQG